MCRTCNGTAAHSPNVGHTVVNASAVTLPGTVAAAGEARPIVTEVAPGFTSTVSIRILKGTDLFPKVPEATCVPRGDRPVSAHPIAISPAVVDVLTTANKDVIAWLAEDTSNAEQFVADPVGVLSRAGVKLTRAQAKELSRAHAAMCEDAVLPPGAQIAKVTVAATKRGKVGDGRGRPGHDNPPDDRPPYDKPPHNKPGTGDAGWSCPVSVDTVVRPRMLLMRGGARRRRVGGSRGSSGGVGGCRRPR